MAVMTPPSLNGRPRKQLSEQLDRLDEIINGLADCLPAAVADATRDGIRSAFSDVVVELMSDPAILARIRATLVPEIAPLAVVSRTSPFAKLKSFLRSLPAKAAAALKSTRQCVTEGYQAGRNRAAHWTLLSLPVKSIVGVSLMVGVAVATISFVAPHPVAAAMSGIGASLTAMAVQVGNWLRRRRAILGLI